MFDEAFEATRIAIESSEEPNNIAYNKICYFCMTEVSYIYLFSLLFSNVLVDFGNVGRAVRYHP